MQQRHSNFRSAGYWTRRYARGGNSGAGSYGRLAKYKAGIINELVRDRSIDSVVEFGVGDGNQAALFEFDSFVGVDVVPQVVVAARKNFADRAGWRFLTNEEYDAAPVQADLTMSLDVIYHLVEDEVFGAYMRRLVAASRKFVLVYASDVDQDVRERHVRHRAYSRWIAENAPHLTEAQTWEHPFAVNEGSDPSVTSFASFRLYEVAA